MDFPREIVPINAEVAGSQVASKQQQPRIMCHISLISLGDENGATAEPCIVVRDLRQTIGTFLTAIYLFIYAISNTEVVYDPSNRKLALSVFFALFVRFVFFVFNCPFASFVLRAVDFSITKNPTASVGSEPAILGSRGQHANP
jgi:hypothetical protein